MSVEKLPKRSPLDPPELKELLEVLVTYPEGTVGHGNQTDAVRKLHDLCSKHGYGYIHQLVESIHSIWTQDEKVEEWVSFYAEHRKLVSKLRRYP